MPRHITCAVAVCRNGGKNGKGLTFYSFPRDPVVCRQWEIKCKRKDTFNVRTACVCSIHFKPEDFERNLKCELLNLTPKFKKLATGAIPTLHLDKCVTQNGAEKKQHESANGIIVTPNQSPQQSVLSEREIRHEKRRIRTSALERIRSLSPLQLRKDQSTFADIEDPEKVAMTVRIKDMEKRIHLFQSNMGRLMNTLQDRNSQIKKLETMLKLSSPLKMPGHTTGSRKEALLMERREKRERKRKDFIVQAVSKIFSHGQLEYLIKREQFPEISQTRRKSINWSSEDLESAKKLKAISPDGYKYLRGKGFPLPGLSTLRHYAKKSAQKDDVVTTTEVLVDDNQPQDLDVAEIVIINMN